MCVVAFKSVIWRNVAVEAMLIPQATGPSVGKLYVVNSVTIGGKKFWVFNSKFIPSFIFVHEVIVHPVCAYRIMSIRVGGI